MRTTLWWLLVMSGCGNALNAVNTNEQPPSPPKQYGGSEAPLVSPCDFDGAAVRPVLAGATATEAFLMRSDGTKVTLVSATNTQTWISTPVTRGTFVAVTTTSIEGNQYVSRLKLFDTGGKELASVAAGDGRLSELGVVATWAPEGGLLLVFADGTTRVEAGLTAAADFGPNGLLPVWKGNGQTRQLQLYDVTTRAVTELQIPVAGWSSPIWSGDMLVYLGDSGEMLQLVRRRGDVELTTPIVATNLNAGLEVEQVTQSFAVLVTGSWVQTRTRLDLETGAVTPLEVTLPSGLIFAGRHSATLADDGMLVAALRKDGAAGLFQSADGKSWTSMGSQVEGATFVQFAGRQGSWVMSAAGTLGWASAKAIGMVPAMGRSVELPSLAGSTPEVDALSHDGRCVAVWTKDSLVAVDLVKGSSRTLLEGVKAPGSASWLR